MRVPQTIWNIIIQVELQPTVECIARKIALLQGFFTYILIYTYIINRFELSEEGRYNRVLVRMIINYKKFSMIFPQSLMVIETVTLLTEVEEALELIDIGIPPFLILQINIIVYVNILDMN